ncbi:succinylglutamate desuccinylase/aspartoacylase family protein [Amycolatopsis pigmentata]|uniref:Succinylglutamate desuccinylase/aspartoacylase family protein n=1 Tax=Amycolatopsis pigmentata TaxID=450801 RepID=A0ABW5G0V5_9PSEU
MQSTFFLGTLEAGAGKTTVGYCEVDLGAEAISLPVAVIHGAEPGPLLAVTAGIHGGEYVSILAARRFLQALDPATVRGTVVISLQSSPLAFRDRVAFVNPIDEENLNRCFPGDAAGTPTQRLANWLWENIIARADFYVDCHCGDLPESLEAFTGLVLSGDSSVDEKSLEMANCWDVERSIVTGTSGSTIWAAAQAGIPAVLVELGERGQWTEGEVERQLSGLMAVAGRVGIIDSHRPGSPTTHPLFEVAAGLSAEIDGLWFPKVKPGEVVTPGAALGTIEDAFGTTVSVITSPTDGVYVYGLTSLAVHAGDFLACIVRPAGVVQ